MDTGYPSVPISYCDDGSWFTSDSVFCMRPYGPWCVVKTTVVGSHRGTRLSNSRKRGGLLGQGEVSTS